MKTLLATLTVAGLAILAAPISSRAADDAPKPDDAAQPEPPKPQLAPAAVDTLKAASEFYKKRNSFSVDVASKLSHQMAGQPKVERSTALTLAAQRPNFFSLQIATPDQAQTVVSDGKTIWNYLHGYQQYVVDDAPKDLETLVRDNSFVREATGKLGSVTSFLRANPMAVYLKGTTKLTKVGEEKIGDLLCIRLHGEDDLMDWDAWFQTGPEPALRRFVFNPLRGMLSNAPDDVREQMKGAKVEATLDYTNWKFDTELPEKTFAFVPPKEAKKVAAIDTNPPEPAAAAQRGGDEPDPAEKLKGQLAQDFELALLDGNKMQLAKHKDKEIVILDFWASWCGPCVRALPEVAAVAESFKDKGVVLYAVNQQEDAATVKKFLEAKKLALTVAMDDKGAAAKLYRVRGIPQTVLIGKNGRIAAVHVGFGPGMKEQLSKEIDHLLANPNEPVAFAAGAPAPAPAAAAPAAPAPAKRASAKDMEGQDAQDFELGLLDGNKMQLAKHKGKDVVILDFWATWCGPCVKALPDITATAEAFKDKGVVFYAVNLKEDAEKVKKFLEAKKLSITVAMDEQGATAQLYRVTGIPQTVIIGKDGKVAAVHIGYNPKMKDELSKELEALLAK